MRIRVQSEPGRRMRKASYMAAWVDYCLDGPIALRICFTDQKISTYMTKHFNEVLRVRIDDPTFDGDMIVSSYSHLDAGEAEVTLKSVEREPS